MIVTAMSVDAVSGIFWLGRGSLLTLWSLSCLVVWFALGLTPYLYFGWHQHQLPFSWGDLSTIEGAAEHLLRSDYGTFQLSPANIEGSFLDNVVRHASWRLPA